MGKELDSAQILRHLEEDMGDLLGLFDMPDVYEIMLNAFRREDGMYEGHIWYEQAGKGMLRLTKNETINLTRYPVPNVGDKVFIRYFINEDGETKILNHHIIPITPKEIKAAMGMVLKTTLLSDKEGFYLEQEEHYRLNVLANNITELGTYYYKQPILEEELNNLDLFIDKINQRLEKLIGVAFRVKIDTVTEANLNLYSQAPKQLISKEFVKMTASKAEQIMGILAAANSVHFHEKNPRLECAIPFYHHRFTGQRQPFVKFPSFTIRKHGSEVVRLQKRVEEGLMPSHVADTIRDWVKRGYNILIGGGTGSGKTALLNTILLEMAEIHPESLNRVGIIEDTPEVQNPIDNAFEFAKTKEVSMDDALVSALRMRPNAIIVGEVRGREAYTLFKAMLTGHKNCMGTIHANGAYEAPFRYEQCIKEHPDCRDMPVPREQICLALNGIISIQKTTVRVLKDGYYENVVKRKVTALREITGYDAEHKIYEDIFYYQDKEAVLEQTKPVNNQYNQYQ